MPSAACVRTLPQRAPCKRDRRASRVRRSQDTGGDSPKDWPATSATDAAVSAKGELTMKTNLATINGLAALALALSAGLAVAR